MRGKEIVRGKEKERKRGKERSFVIGGRDVVIEKGRRETIMAGRERH